LEKKNWNKLMPIITSVKPQKSGKRLNVYLDNKFAFGIDLENFVKNGLKVKLQLSEDKVKEIVKKAEFQKTLDKVLRFVTLRPRSEKEINDWLKRKKIHESLYKELFDRLKRLELVDDEKFARWWVNQRSSFRPKPKRILNNELRIKGIEKEIIEEVLKEENVDEEKIARELLEKKKYKWKKLDRKIARQKMSGYLARKGFEWDAITRAVDVFIKK